MCSSDLASLIKTGNIDFLTFSGFCQIFYGGFFCLELTIDSMSIRLTFLSSVFELLTLQLLDFSGSDIILQVDNADNSNFSSPIF